MATSQTGILHDGGPLSAALVLQASGGTDGRGDPGELVRRAARASRLFSEIASLDPEAGFVATLAFGAEAMRAARAESPAELQPFTAIGGQGGAPATGGDVLLHVHSTRVDLNFEALARFRTAVGAAARVTEEVAGFRYLDSRDLTGFVDGTENPEPDERAEVALVGDEDPSFRGGSYVLTQRYVHDLAGWSQLAVEEQEQIIGRTRATDQELPDDVRPDTAHISRVVIEEDGEELEIFRKSFPYGTTSEAGLYFLAHCRTPRIFLAMLERMFGVSDGVSDRLMSFSRAVSGAVFFAPSQELLTELAE